MSRNCTEILDPSKIALGVLTKIECNGKNIAPAPFSPWQVQYKSLLILGCNHSEPHLHAGLNYDVHQREQQLAQDILHEDGGCVAVV